MPEGNVADIVTVPSLAMPGGLAQMSAGFGAIGEESVSGDTVGVNCVASGLPAAHATNCGCVAPNGNRNFSVGTA